MNTSGFWTAIVTVLTALVGLAVVSVALSKNSQTPQVLNSFWGGFAGSLATAVSPTTGTGASAGYFGAGGGNNGGGGLASMLTGALPNMFTANMI
jgi:hypothetical protein